MLISGPTEWSEALLATGVKVNLLQNGYNPKLQVSAMPLGPTVAITRYADTDATTGFARGVLDQPIDTLVLHEDGSNSDKRTSNFRLVAWSHGSTEKSLLAIASTTQVEIWEITVTSGISATLKGSVVVDCLQGLAWNPHHDVLLVYPKTDIQLIDASQEALSWRTIHKTSTHQAWSGCSWSPCGLHVSLAQKNVLHCFGWASVESLLSEPPRHDQVDASSSLNGLRLDVNNAAVGPIAAVARVSPTISIVTTDTKLILENVSRVDTTSPAMNSGLQNITTPPALNQLLQPESSHSLVAEVQAVDSSSDIIDLTSIRVSTSSTQNPLQILNHIEDPTPRQDILHDKPRSHLLIVEYTAGKWGAISQLNLPHLTSPDILVVQEMRAIIGSTLSSRLLVAHLDISDNMQWTASLSGELELPPTHVCRGIYLAGRSPFVDVASVEKRKRATFFHAAANMELQPIYLSKLKVPRRARSKPSAKPVDNAQELTPSAAEKVPTCSDADDRNGGNSKDLLELILVKMAAMQTQLNSRFDIIDEKLQQLTTRVAQLEQPR